MDIFCAILKLPLLYLWLEAFPQLVHVRRLRDTFWLHTLMRAAVHLSFFAISATLVSLVLDAHILLFGGSWTRDAYATLSLGCGGLILGITITVGLCVEARAMRRQMPAAEPESSSVGPSAPVSSAAIPALGGKT